MAVLIGGIRLIILLCGVIYVFYCGVYKNGNVASWSWRRAYECGYCPKSLRFKYFSLRYIVLLVFFVVLDLEISLLVKMPEQGLLFDKFVYYEVFLWVLGLGFSVEVIFGYMRWGY